PYFSSCRSATTLPDGGASPGGSITAAGPRTCGRAAPRAVRASAWSRSPRARGGALRVAIPRRHEVPVLARVGAEDRERPEAAPLLARLDPRDRHTVEPAFLHARVEVAHVSDRPPHHVDHALEETGEGPETRAVREL